MLALSFLMIPWIKGEKIMIIVNCRYSISIPENDKQDQGHQDVPEIELEAARLQQSRLAGEFADKDRNRIIKVFLKKRCYLAAVFNGPHKKRLDRVRNPEFSSRQIYLFKYQSYRLRECRRRVLHSRSQRRHSTVPGITVRRLFSAPYAHDKKDRGNGHHDHRDEYRYGRKGSHGLTEVNKPITGQYAV